MFKLKSLMCMGFKRLHIPKIEFPEGRVLIQGRNESGKSTIMEAIHYALYGIALKPRKNASNEDLINYGLPKAVVELRFTIDDNLYTVRRTLKRRRTNVHELVIERRDGTRERVRGARTVNKTIKEELHGIDSEALLNSCLVEQKELGKLESGLRMERIRAMTTLLNLEAFVDAQQALKGDARELESTNRETSARLEMAKLAKKLYDEAQLKCETARKRIQEIEEQSVGLAKRIGELEKILESIEEIKGLNKEIDEIGARLDGLQGELRRVEGILKEVIDAEESAKKIEEKLPIESSKLDEANRKVGILDELIKLRDQLDEARKEADRARERLEEASGKVEKARAAEERVKELESQIADLEPARDADELLPGIDVLAQSLGSANSELKRLEGVGAELKSKLESLKDADARISELEKREGTLQASRESISRRRTLGIVMAVLGAIASISFTLSSYLAAIGLPVALIGAFLIIRNSPSKIESRLKEVRGEREDLLGERTRIEDYSRQSEENQRARGEEKSKAAGSELEIRETISRLPKKPRKYAEIIVAGEGLNLGSVPELRKAIQYDLQSLTKLETERVEKAKLAEELEVNQRAMEEAKAKKKEVLGQIENTRKVKGELEEREKVSIDQEEEIRSAKEGQQRSVQELRINLENYRELASKKEKVEKEKGLINASIEKLQKDIKKRETHRERIQGEIGVGIEEEQKLRAESDKLKGERSGLETEKKERASDIEESEKIIDENRELTEEHPKLVEKDAKEKLELESMRRGSTLLETTRDGIIAGVKGRIETHMMAFLPMLTAQRYNMARIDERKYRIEVFDREARRWRGKGIFSGATQDQFSLALRLAFALSTIPSSRGARPGFIFLDEPLSGFDSQRRDGLLRLLREELPSQFDQIIVISHLEELRDEFPMHIQLEAGEVVKSTISL